MLWNPLAALSGLVFCSMMALILLSSLRRSRFGWLIIFVEYFYILGLGVFPLLLSVGAIDAPEFAIAYEWRHGEVAPVTFLHIILYGLGALFGYFGGRPAAKIVSLRIASFASNNRIDNYAWFYVISGMSLLFSGLYLYGVGVETAIVNASLARRGDFSGLVGFEHYQFLKTLATIGVFSLVFAPYIVIDGKRIKSTFLIITVLAVLIYLLNVARVTFYDTLVLFALFYLILGRSQVSSSILSIAIFIFMIFVLFFGKEFVGVLSVYLYEGGDLAFLEKDVSAAVTFFGHFGSLVYSIDAGIRNFFSAGPILPMDIVVSPLGFLPSFAYSALGMDFLSYQLLDESQRLSCINTQSFVGLDECSMPPYLPGMSAYLLPVAGGFLFGFLRFWIYSVIETSWIRLKDRPELLWLPVFSLLIANRLMLFIPNTISFAVFVLLVMFICVSLRKLLVRALQSSVSSAPSM